MLSILIPTYNYNVFPLVESIHQQCLKENINFEIIVLDDASANLQTIEKNNTINTLPNCSYELLGKNIGRSKIRNLLAKKAAYSWLIFFDADTLPVNDKLIANYLPHLDNEEKVIYGGIKYQEKKPDDNLLLRWIYGNEREALPKKKRKEAPYLSLLTLNFAIKKSVFNKVTFNETIPNLRYEDVLFSYELLRAKIKTEHIENPVYHLGLDTSEIFLKKTEDSLIGLKYLIDNKLLPAQYLRISSLYKKIKSAGLIFLLRLFFKLSKKQFRKNLLGRNPSLFIFDLYRLGYLSSL